jgi:hypothetical protein
MRGHNEGSVTRISTQEIIRIHFFGRGTIPFKVEMKGPQRLDGGFRPSRLRTTHHMMVEPVRVLQRKKSALSNKAISSPYLSLKFADGEEGVRDRLAFLHLDRIVIRERGGASRHLERSELAFNIEGDNPGPTSEADIVNSRRG